MKELAHHYHAVSESSFAAIAAGQPDPATVRQLLDSQLSVEYLLTAHVLRSAREMDHIRQAVKVMSDAQHRAPHEVSEMWRAAWLGVWTTRCLTTLDDSARKQREPPQPLARLGSVAAAAALRAGLDAETWTMAMRGSVVVPTLGVATLSTSATRWVRLVVRDGCLTIHGGDGEVITPSGVGWDAMRRLYATEAGRRLSLGFDDLDPLRDCYDTPLADRVSPARLALWWERFAEAWSLLCRHAPQRADELSHTMRVLVPLADHADQDTGEVSATSADAPGALAVRLPRDGARFAVALVHENAHSLLNCLLNLVPLFEWRDTNRYFAPWRNDPRPIEGLLHGAYAFLAVTHTWLSLAVEPRFTRLAQFECALRRAQLEPALDTLASTGALTPAGRRFVTIMRDRFDKLMSQPIAAEATTRANQIVALQQANWRARFGNR